MPFHICMDEVRMFFWALASVGGLTGAIYAAQHLWHRLRHRGSPKDDGCCDGHDHN